MMDDVQGVSASHWFGHDTAGVWLVCGVMSGRKRWSGCDASDDGMGTGTSVVGGHELAAAASVRVGGMEEWFAGWAVWVMERESDACGTSRPRGNES